MKDWRKNTPWSSWAILSGLLMLTATGLFACNPFLPTKGGEGEPCLGTGVCKGELLCVAGTCRSAVDGGDDGGDGEDGGGDPGDGDPDPCLAPDLDCSQANLPGQGTDGDTDGWGLCCDCDDGNPDVHPGATETPYNGRDDDCQPSTRDDDLDEDGFLGSDGSDCDDGNFAVNPDAEEDCNGVDDNCDQQTDEGLTQVPCPLTEGVCAGTMRSCQGAAGYSDCVYPDTHSLDPETTCDLLDNDCDGQTDEDGQLILEPEAGDQASDGLDNNCNGLIDEPGGVLVAIPVPLHHGVWIDAFEMTVFENADCTGTRYGAGSDDYPLDWPADGTGQGTLYGCSLPGIVPSGHLSWYQAKLACEAQGKRLCHRDEYRDACSRDTQAGDYYPYGAIFTQQRCNDALGGSGGVEPSGQRETCAAPDGTHDMSGNLAEWILEWSTLTSGNAITAGWGYACQLCYYGDACAPCQAGNTDHNQWIGFLSMCTAGDVFGNLDPLRAFPAAEGRPFIGGRCCYEPE